MLNADLENFTIDQFAGALALSLGAVGSLLLVIWQSKCHCRINLCYLFTCERKPGPTEEDPKNKKDKKTEASGEAQSKAVGAVPSTPKAPEREAVEIQLSPPNP